MHEIGADAQKPLPSNRVMKPQQVGLGRLENENDELRMERDILNAATAPFAKESM